MQRRPRTQQSDFVFFSTQKPACDFPWGAEEYCWGEEWVTSVTPLLIIKRKWMKGKMAIQNQRNKKEQKQERKNKSERKKRDKETKKKWKRMCAKKALFLKK